MKIIGDTPVWAKVNKEIGQKYPSLSKNIETDVVVVGGGSTGALTSHYLMKQGIKTVLVDKFEIGMTATSATTAILQYEIDCDLIGLKAHAGEQEAKDAFLYDYQAVMEIGQIVKEINSDCQFNFTPCFYYTEDPGKIDYMEDECKQRQAIGIHCELYKPETHPDKFSFNYTAGIFSHYGGATMDPLRFTRDLIDYNAKNGLNVYEHTNIVDFDLSDKGVTLRTDMDFEIKATRVIFCTGYDALTFFDEKNPFVKTARTFSIVSKPVESFTGWEAQCIIRDDKSPYTYLRTTPDNRIIIGGEDVAFNHLDDEVANMGSRHPLALQQYHQLLKRARQMFPSIENIKTDYWYHGVFADTKDTLPFIGKHPDYPGAYFNLGYGSNGILYSLIGSKLIVQDYQGYNPKELQMYRFNRY
ncbi:MAG TPA: FAD-binding oxidoreductase [Firmicutes bacterium]|nr:FAD-binding oxidoreductase [Bacillota bacterium]